MPETAAKHPLVDILTVNFTVNCKGVTTGHRCCGTCPGTVWSIPDVSCRATACPGRLLVDKLWVEESEWVEESGWRKVSISVRSGYGFRSVRMPGVAGESDRVEVVLNLLLPSKSRSRASLMQTGLL